MAHKLKERKEKPFSRRSFLSKLALTSASAAGILAFLGAIRLSFPKVIREKTLIKIGYIDDFPLNTFTMLPDKKIFVYRDRQGIKAISAVCTHLGCILTKIPDGFQCPCHGSYFNPAGKVKFGPAPRSLSWYRIEITPNGLLYVDLSKKVDSETIFIP